MSNLKVSDWRIEWERVWSGDTGMDIQGTLSKLELIGDSEVHVHSDWRVSIHDVRLLIDYMLSFIFTTLSLMHTQIVLFVYIYACKHIYVCVLHRMEVRMRI